MSQILSPSILLLFIVLLSLSFSILPIWEWEKEKKIIFFYVYWQSWKACAFVEERFDAWDNISTKIRWRRKAAEISDDIVVESYIYILFSCVSTQAVEFKHLNLEKKRRLCWLMFCLRGWMNGRKTRDNSFMMMVCKQPFYSFWNWAYIQFTLNLFLKIF